MARSRAPTRLSPRTSLRRQSAAIGEVSNTSTRGRTTSRAGTAPDPHPSPPHAASSAGPARRDAAPGRAQLSSAVNYPALELFEEAPGLARGALDSGMRLAPAIWPMCGVCPAGACPSYGLGTSGVLVCAGAGVFFSIRRPVNGAEATAGRPFGGLGSV
jgi:hypothetical protein